jgi:hypothetical protein
LTTLPIWDSVLLDRLARSAAALVAAALTSAALTSAGMPAAWTSVTAPVIVVMCQLSLSASPGGAARAHRPR